MYRNTFLSVMFLACCFNGSLCAQSDAQIYERTCDAKTYPFSDPSPVATPNNSYYPSNPQLISSASFLRLNVLSSLN